MGKIHMSKRMRIMLISVGILFGLIFIYKAIISYIIKYSMTHHSKVVSVSAMKVTYSNWQPKLTASGSVRAIRGVDVTTELAGLVSQIYFTPGSVVTEGTLLVQLRADTEIAQLRSLEANAELAKTTYVRDKAQYDIHAISKQALDVDAANLKSANAQVDQQAAVVVKKTIYAPFTGRLGINYVNPGQFLNPGDRIVSLQMVDPIYVDFYMPQQTLALIRVGMPVSVVTDTFPNKIFKGKITTINPAVDTATRNVVVEATIDNKNSELAPGMFATVDVDTGTPKKYLTLPQTAISFNSYGNIVYIVKREETKEKDKPRYLAMQSFVVTGETRGDQITVLKGLKNGDTVVTSGQLKLKNGSEIEINNSIVPPNNPAPRLTNK